MAIIAGSQQNNQNNGPRLKSGGMKGYTDYLPDILNAMNSTKYQPSPAQNAESASSQPQVISQTNGAFKSNFGSGDVAIRDSMVSTGLNNDDIGWENGYVTYKNQPVVKASKVEDGKSYGDWGTVSKAINQARGGSDDMKDVTQAAAGYGIANAIEYNDNSVSLGGIPIENTVIVNGQAYAPQSAITAAYEKFKADTGYKTNKDVYNEYDAEYGTRAHDIEDAIKNYGEFSYNPEDDPSYQAYKKIYTKNAQDAMKDSYGTAAAMSGGYGSSAAMAAGNQAYLNHMSQLDSVIPTLEQNAYSKYRDKYGDLYNELDLYGDAKSRYANEYNAESSDRDDVHNATDADYKRNTDSRDYNADRSDVAWKQSYSEQEMQNNIDQFNKNFNLELSRYENIELPEAQAAIKKAYAELDSLLFNNKISQEQYEKSKEMLNARLEGQNLANENQKLINAALENGTK